MNRLPKIKHFRHFCSPELLFPLQQRLVRRHGSLAVCGADGDAVVVLVLDHVQLRLLGAATVLVDQAGTGGARQLRRGQGDIRQKHCGD